MYDEKEEDRLEHIQIAKSRGKGTPKKKRTAAGEFPRAEQLCRACMGIIKSWLTAIWY